MIADLVAALLLSLSGIAVDTSNPYRLAATSAAYVLFSYAFFWLLRRFGFLAVVSMWLMNNLVVRRPVYIADILVRRTNDARQWNRSGHRSLGAVGDPFCPASFRIYVGS